MKILASRIGKELKKATHCAVYEPDLSRVGPTMADRAKLKSLLSPKCMAGGFATTRTDSAQFSIKTRLAKEASGSVQRRTRRTVMVEPNPACRGSAPVRMHLYELRRRKRSSRRQSDFRCAAIRSPESRILSHTSFAPGCGGRVDADGRFRSEREGRLNSLFQLRRFYCRWPAGFYLRFSTGILG